MASNGQESGGSVRSLSKRGRKSGKIDKEHKVRQRGLGIAELESLRLQTQMAPATGRSVIPNQLQRDLNSFQIGADSSSLSLWHTSNPTQSSTHIPQNMCMDSDGCDLTLGLSTSIRNEDEDLEFRHPNYFTDLLLAQDSEEEKENEQESKKARTNSLGAGSLAAPGSSSNEEPDLELRL